MPIKTIEDKRTNYLVSLEKVYKDLGYTTRLRSFNSKLEVYPKGFCVPKSEEEMVIEKWID
jgi:hypothetical protein